MCALTSTVLSLIGGAVYLALAADRLVAWSRHTDPDARWHLLGWTLGCGVALGLYLSR